MTYRVISRPALLSGRPLRFVQSQMGYVDLHSQFVENPRAVLEGATIDFGWPATVPRPRRWYHFLTGGRQS